MLVCNILKKGFWIIQDRFLFKEAISYAKLRGSEFACKHPLSFKITQDVCVFRVLSSVASSIPLPLEKGMLCQQSVCVRNWDSCLTPRREVDPPSQSHFQQELKLSAQNHFPKKANSFPWEYLGRSQTVQVSECMNLCRGEEERTLFHPSNTLLVWCFWFLDRLLEKTNKDKIRLFAMKS